MGMYTQVRGWLNVDSIGDASNFNDIENTLIQAKKDFKASGKDLRLWVCENTIVHFGGNGSAFLFVGTELKNYDGDAEEWIKFLLPYFPNAAGRIDFQYEGERPWNNLDEKSDNNHEHNPWFSRIDDEGSYSTFWLIQNGAIVKEDKCKTWCKGYGNMWKK